MLSTPILTFLNHLLTIEEWASARLRPFAGQVARFEAGHMSLLLKINGDGSFSQAPIGSAPHVCVTLPNDTAFRLLTDRGSIFATAQISGSAELAEALGFVFRNLRWDAEGDLARVFGGTFGDIFAHRSAKLARGFFSAQQASVKNLAANMSEFILEETTLLSKRSEAICFAKELEQLCADLTRLETRISLLDK